MPDKTLTLEHFESFKKSCKKYIEKFKITDWQFYYSFEDLKKQGKDYYATTKIQLLGRVITIRLNKKFFYFDSDNSNNQLESVIYKSLDETAKHEIIHVLIGGLTTLANERCVIQDEIDLANESLVVHLQNLL